MCTAISFNADNHYFGRNLDLEFCYNETVTITPRNFAFGFRKTNTIKSHYAIIGVATVAENYPLYYDATNEKGLSIAGLNFPENAYYNRVDDTKINIAPFELISTSNKRADYEIRIKTSRAGVHNFAFRIYPKHPLMQNRMELPLVKWI